MYRIHGVVVADWWCGSWMVRPCPVLVSLSGSPLNVAWCGSWMVWLLDGDGAVLLRAREPLWLSGTSGLLGWDIAAVKAAHCWVG